MNQLISKSQASLSQISSRITNATISKLSNQIAEYKDLLKMVPKDDQILPEIHSECSNLLDEIINLHKSTFFTPLDYADCIIEVNAGAGGHESHDFTKMITKMYASYCKNNGIPCEIVDFSPGEIAGWKSAVVTLSTVNEIPVFGIFKHEIGAHRLVRTSLYDSAGRRHTSFTNVNVIASSPQSSTSITPSNIPQSEIKIETMRAQGAGGQHVNTTDSAVRVTHIPTNITAFCQNERSQGQNKKTALKILAARLNARQEGIRKSERKQEWEGKPDTAWGTHIRSYTGTPYKLVKDLRTGVECRDYDGVFNGDKLDLFLDAAVVKFGGEAK